MLSRQAPPVMGPFLLVLATALSTGVAIDNYADTLALRLNAPGCGTVAASRRGRIVRGQEAAQGEFPWAVSIQALKKGRRRRGACGGSLVSKRHVVTAGHCILANHTLSVILGKVDISRPLAAPGLEVEIEKAVRHPDFQILDGGKGIINNIAILTLAQDVEFTDNIRPICLSHRDPARLDNPENDYSAVGWGVTSSGRQSDVLLYTMLRAVPLDTCNKFETYASRIELNESQLCAVSSSSSPCRGDSGGPLAAKLEGKWYLAGITSFGSPQCDLDVPGVFSRIASFTPFLGDNILDDPFGEVTATDAITLFALEG